MNVVRRMGPKGSEIWVSMLDAAEDILCEEGYGGLTSRNVADRIGVKQRLVYYYFRTMDELIVETFRRLAIREKERLAKALASAQPLREVWNVYIETNDTRLVSEFMALANRIDDLRVEVKLFIEESRKLQIAALEQARSAGKAEEALPAIATAFFATSAALAMHREAALGIEGGHDEVRAAIDEFISTIEPGS
ncbi:MAG: helix-turn-helix domain containing protein [Novosphingobium sp.]|nr:helix-turn-helix domain containing protein [Novosphingobium sp.]